MPNRYHTYTLKSLPLEHRTNLEIIRIPIPKHKNGLLDQLFSYKKYFVKTLKIVRKEKFDLVFASSGRLFTAFLACIISQRKKIPLYLDVRDIFMDTIKDVYGKRYFIWLMLKVFYLIEKFTFSRANHINLISPGFEPYFRQFRSPRYSFYTNGIDKEFLNIPQSKFSTEKPFIITYAGNIGEGQGLEKIIPKTAKRLGNDYLFRIIGDGGRRLALMKELENVKASNVEIIAPVSRDQLIKYYCQTNFLFLHLNDYEAFKKVLPSKIFEYAATDKPIIAGVSGYARQFISENIHKAILFNPGDVEGLVKSLLDFKFSYENRSRFKERFDRQRIDESMAKSILSYI